ncbi:LytR/AlgR family response regulator transcription factor, partial [Psychroflexus sp. MES1-P1E]|uniref:LytR/AlgR family response regulator transcription factor n=1 Tax=Psychroflexus sp. MES1-P1E TaxID=2058320 RepID=UPI000C7DDB27
MSFHKIRCLIIDDDPFITELLQDKINHYFPDLKVLSVAKNGNEGIEEINKHIPELIFLDVEMADMTGFEMLSYFSEIYFQTIFITSYSHYAIKAIRFNALDYLLKPIDLGELKRAINRFKIRKKSDLQKENLSLALKNVANKNVSNHILNLKTQDGNLNLVLNDILHIEGQRNYSYIYLKNGSKKLVTKTLIELEELLDSKGFYRCHKSHILNAKHITSYTNGNLVQLSQSIKVPISRRKKKSFR